MALTPGSRLGPYEILSAIGAGGMGEVYRARDTKLNRDVAVKVLPDSFALDTDRLARFHREAQVLASLNHPNIAAIYGFEDSNAAHALVMELVEGPTLAERLEQLSTLKSQRSGMPLDEALPIAKQIAEALEAAHEQGIIHRDLKPANVKVRDDGSVKVLDFGLAKAMDPTAASNVNASMSPTLSVHTTMAGVILGTAGYMSPEQASGKAVDKRADIWAFGVVLFELLTGRRLFEGETIAHTLADVLKGEIDLAKLPLETPVALRDLVRRCLDRNPKSRLRDIGEARLVLERAIAYPESPDLANPANLGNLANPANPGIQRALPWILAGSAVIGLIAVLALWAPWRTSPPLPETRLELTTPPTPSPASIAISPDGRQIVFVAASDGPPRLWLRPLNSESAKVLAGTDDATNPFWSPDNRSIGFFADYKLKRIDLNGGSVRVLANARISRGGTWSRDGVILFAPSGDSPLFRVAASGGEPTAVTQLLPQQQYHGFPRFLPDGRHFLYYAVTASPNVRGVYVGALDSPDARRLFDADTAAEYASSGHLLFVRQGRLLAQRFDAVRLEVAGEPFAVAEYATIAEGGGPNPILGALSVSSAGPIVYRAGGIGGSRQFAWFDRFGKELGRIGSLHGGASISLAPNGRRLAVSRTVNGNSDIWLFEVERGIFSRFTSDAASEFFPLWSPDGNRIVFNSNRRQGMFDLYQKAAAGTGPEQLLLATPLGAVAEDWSPDGRYLLYRPTDPKTGRDLWALPMGGTDKPFAVAQTQAEEANGQFSPDGRWVAYESDESGRFEIYAQPFPGPAARVQISTAGGGQARWRGDAKEIFYVALDGRLMAVPIRFSASSQTLDVSAPVPLFATRVGPAVTNNRQQYTVSPDGQRFLMNTLTEETGPITVLLNWNAQAK